MGFFDKILNKNASNGPLPEEWTKDRTVTLDKMPDNLEEMKAAVDVTDPGSVAAYFVYAVAGLPGDYDTGMSMMKYLFVYRRRRRGKSGLGHVFQRETEGRRLPLAAQSVFRGRDCRKRLQPAETARDRPLLQRDEYENNQRADTRKARPPQHRLLGHEQRGR